MTEHPAATGGLSIRDAAPADAPRLTAIAFSAKRHWRYPEAYYQAWENELTVTEQYFIQNIVRCIAGDDVVGFYSLCFLETARRFGEVCVESGWWLDHMFIEARWIGQGLGTRLFVDMILALRQRGAGRVRLFADPHAAGFYEKLGCRFVRNSGSSIPERTVPVYEYAL
jgi:GNAT superfamily N-acetyltransferase